jgi:hypothetical protein
MHPSVMGAGLIAQTVIDALLMDVNNHALPHGEYMIMDVSGRGSFQVKYQMI